MIWIFCFFLEFYVNLIEIYNLGELTSASYVKVGHCVPQTCTKEDIGILALHLLNYVDYCCSYKPYICLSIFPLSMLKQDTVKANLDTSLRFHEQYNTTI